MPILEMKVPSPGESISEVEIATWLVSDGDYVEKDQAIAEVDSDKATLELPAEAAGVITLKAEEGDVVPVGDVCCLIDTDAERPAGAPAPEPKPEAVPAPAAAPTPASVAAAPAAPAPAPLPPRRRVQATRQGMPLPQRERQWQMQAFLQVPFRGRAATAVF